ncbi:MAG: hypothetical protein JSS99_00110 [Actinobacteria bacterium]|nr:hypothetical protein [Actinomycetota bacterium]
MVNRIRRKLAAAAAVAALVAATGSVVAAPASAKAGNCRAGLVNATMAWGNCDVVAAGWNGYRLTVQCYFWGANSVVGFPGATTYATCPGWSHVTRILIYPL